MGNAVIWVKFASIEDFEAWHDLVKTELGLPKPSVDAQGNVMPDAVISTDYTQPVIVAENDVRAFIDPIFSGDYEISENPYGDRYENSVA